MNVITGLLRMEKTAEMRIILTVVLLVAAGAVLGVTARLLLTTSKPSSLYTHTSIPLTGYKSY